MRPVKILFPLVCSYLILFQSSCDGGGADTTPRSSSANSADLGKGLGEEDEAFRDIAQALAEDLLTAAKERQELRAAIERSRVEQERQRAQVVGTLQVLSDRLSQVDAAMKKLSRD